MDSILPLAAARLRDVRRRHGAVLALDGVDLEVRGGEVLALLGPNGAGKSTAVGLLLGLLAPDAGEVSVFGGNPARFRARRAIGVMLQEAALPETLRVAEVINLVRSYYPAPLPLAKCARLAGIADLLTRRCGKLSGGQQRRVQFAMAICGNARLLVLDEPTTGLDIESRQAIWAAIRARAEAGGSVLLTTHYLEEAEALADRISVLVQGRIVAEGSVDEIRARVSQRRIRCRTTLPLALLAGWPGVRTASLKGDRVELTTDAAEDLLRRLLAADPQLSALEVQRAGLAEAFLALTRSSDAAAREAA